MAKPRNLTPKQTRFVAEYLIDLNPRAAYERAGYATKGRGGRVNACKLLRSTAIKAALAEHQARQVKKVVEQLDAAEVDGARVFLELCRIGLTDARSFYDDKGQPIPLSELTPAQGAALANVEVIVKNARAGDGHTDTVLKYRFWDKPRALELLAKRFGLLVERFEGRFTFSHELPE